jgi:hypothetical protein
MILSPKANQPELQYQVTRAHLWSRCKLVTRIHNLVQTILKLRQVHPLFLLRFTKRPPSKSHILRILALGYLFSVSVLGKCTLRSTCVSEEQELVLRTGSGTAWGPFSALKIASENLVVVWVWWGVWCRANRLQSTDLCEHDYTQRRMVLTVGKQNALYSCPSKSSRAFHALRSLFVIFFQTRWMCFSL